MIIQVSIFLKKYFLSILLSSISVCFFFFESLIHISMFSASFFPKKCPNFKMLDFYDLLNKT